jgi:hypothetical protein
MLNPTLVKDGPGGNATLLPAQYKDDEIRLALKTSPEPVAFIEKILGGRSTTNNKQSRISNKK